MHSDRRDLATSFRSFPSYWLNMTPTRWRRRAGDADHDEKMESDHLAALLTSTKFARLFSLFRAENDARVTIANGRYDGGRIAQSEARG